MTPSRHRRTPLIAILTAAVLVALFVTDMLTIGGIIASRGWITRTRQAQGLIDSVRGELLDAETGERDFLLTGRSEYLEAYRAAISALPKTLSDLRRLTADDLAQGQNVDALSSLVEQKLAELRLTLELYRRVEILRALDIVRSDEAAALTSWIRQLIAEMRAHEDMRLNQRTIETRRHLDAALWIDIAALGGLMVLGLIFFALNRDIGRREALEKALRDQAALQERFIAILGHDLRNPLNAVLMAARRLKQVDRSETSAKSIDYVISGARRMTRLVDQLLDLARARQAGGIPVKPLPGTDLGEIVDTAIDELRAANPRAEIVVNDNGPQGPIVGAWDPDRLVQVVSNLVGNAIVHGTGRVDVRVGRIGGDAVIEVQNAGQPIPDDMVPRIFEAFQRPAAGDQNARAGGLGLGLFIVERIVAAHRGRITVRSNEEEGTTAGLTTPASYLPVTPPETMNAIASEASTATGVTAARGTITS